MPFNWGSIKGCLLFFPFPCTNQIRWCLVQNLNISNIECQPAALTLHADWMSWWPEAHPEVMIKIDCTYLKLYQQKWKSMLCYQVLVCHVWQAWPDNCSWLGQWAPQGTWSMLCWLASLTGHIQHTVHFMKCNLPVHRNVLLLSHQHPHRSSKECWSNTRIQKCSFPPYQAVPVN